MKKINSRKYILTTAMTLAMVISASYTTANADAFGGTNITPQQMQMIQDQGGLNQMHDTNHLRERYQENYRNEDYNYYQERKKLEKDPDAGNQIIQNYNGGSIQQATVEELNTKGVFVNSVEVAPSEILTKEEINKLVQPIVGKNVFIEDIQKVIDSINNLYAEKGFVTARAFLPEQTVENGNIYIALTESKIGSITVSENKWTKDGYITSRLPQKEGELLLSAVPEGGVIIALDERGKHLSSEEFAHRLGTWQDNGIPAAAFLIGGADGHSPEVRQKAHLLLAFGKMTWPHMLARAMLAEQIYRAKTILDGHPYHRS